MPSRAKHPLEVPFQTSHQNLDPCPGSLLTTPTSTSPITQRENLLPLPHTPNPPLAATLPSAPSPEPPRPHLVCRERTLDARPIASVTVPHHPTGIPVLNPAHRIVRVNLAQLDLGQDHARQPRKHLIDTLPAERADLHRDRHMDTRRPPTSLARRDLAPIRRNRGALRAGPPAAAAAAAAVAVVVRPRRRRRGDGAPAHGAGHAAHAVPAAALLVRRRECDGRGRAVAARRWRRHARVDQIRAVGEVELVAGEDEGEVWRGQRARVVEEGL